MKRAYIILSILSVLLCAPVCARVKLVVWGLQSSEEAAAFRKGRFPQGTPVLIREAVEAEDAMSPDGYFLVSGALCPSLTSVWMSRRKLLPPASFSMTETSLSSDSASSTTPRG